MIKNKLAINQGTIAQCDTGKFIEVSSEAGFDSVELRIPMVKEYLYYHTSQELKDKLEREEISVISLNALDGFALIPETNIKIIEQESALVGTLCEMIGCSLVVAPVSRYNGRSLSRDYIKDTTITRLKRVDEILSDYGVSLGFEPIGFPDFTVRTIDFSDEIIKDSGIKNMGLVLDIHNLFLSETGPDSFGKAQSPVHIIHINDVEDMPRDHLDVMDNRVLLGEGQANPSNWIKAALDSDYTGPFSLELFRKEIWNLDPLVAAKQCYNNIKEYLKNL